MSARNIQTDVLVVGGGTAGFGAAVAAGRQGLHVILLEASSKIGGVMAFCPGMPWGGGYPDDRIIGGLLQELTDRLAAMDPPAAVPATNIKARSTAAMMAMTAMANTTTRRRVLRVACA